MNIVKTINSCKKHNDILDEISKISNDSVFTNIDQTTLDIINSGYNRIHEINRQSVINTTQHNNQLKSSIPRS